MELVSNLIEFVIHLDRHLFVIIQSLGYWSYFLLFTIIFAETGLVVTPFLPGDSLLFAVGTFAAVGYFNLAWLILILISAAIIGDSANYALGKLFGKKMIQSGEHRFFKKEHIERTHRFYEKYGGKTIILARFVPIIRTFAPFVAGIGEMTYYKFFIYNVTGAFLWVIILVLAGYYFGNVPFVKNNFSIAIVVVIIISLLPVIIEFYKHRKKRNKAEYNVKSAINSITVNQRRD